MTSKSIDTSSVDGYYEFDPSTGIVCTSCLVPVFLSSKYSLGHSLLQHELSKRHCQTKRNNTTKAEQAAIITNFQAYIKQSVTIVRGCLPCMKAVNEQFLSLIGTTEQYDFCSKCNVLTVDKQKHTSNRCFLQGYFGETKFGVKNKFWMYRNPQPILVEDFHLDRSTHLITPLFKKLWDDSSLCSSLPITDGDNGVVATRRNPLSELLKKQSIIFQNEKQSRVIKLIDNKLNPNLYVTRLHWDLLMDGCSLPTICSMKEPDRFGKIEDGIDVVLERIYDALWYALRCGQSIPSSHPVMRTLGTKDGGVTDHALSLNLEGKTWKRYFGYIKTICLFLFRVKNTKNRFHRETLPVVDFTEQQLAFMDKMVADDGIVTGTTTCHELHLAFLHSLIDHSVGDLVYRCPLIAGAAMLSVS